MLQFIQLGLEEEALHQLRAPIGGSRPVVGALPEARAEQILHEQFNNVVLRPNHPLAPWLLQSKQTRLCYGYPLLARGDGTVWPLFVLKMRVDQGGGGFVTQVEPWTNLRLNRGLLRHLGLDDEAIQAIAASALDGQLGFADRLAAVTQALGLPAGRFDPHALDAPPDEYQAAPADGWINCPLLFVTSVAPQRRALAGELAGLHQPTKRAMAPETALRPFVKEPDEEATGEDGEEEARTTLPLVFDVHASGPSQSAAIRSALQNPLTLVSAPPGTGQIAAVLNLIATSVLREESVLYVSPLRASVDQMQRHVEGLIGKDLPFVMRIGADAENAERTQQQRDALFALARADQESEPAQKSKRDKPTIKGLKELEQAAPDTEAAAARLREAHRAVAAATAELRAMSLTLGPHWAGRQAAKANPTFNRDTLADWRQVLQELAGDKAPGLGQRVMGLLSRSDPRAELIRELRQAYTRLPKEVHEPIFKAIDKDDGLGALHKAIDALDTYLDWRDLVTARLDAIRKLARMTDTRALELQQLNYTSSKTSAARELFRDHWNERLTRNIPLLDKQIDTFCDLLAREPSGDPRQNQQQALKLTRAITVLSKTLPVWVATVDAVVSRLPQQGALFDLVIVDDCEEVELASILPVLFRARRAMVIGAIHRLPGNVPVQSLVELGPIKQAAQAQPTWLRDPLARAMPALAGALEGEETSRELTDHFRSHPLVAEYLNRTFYDARLRVRTNVRTLTAGLSRAHAGVHWHGAVGRMQALLPGLPEVNLGEIDVCVSVLKRWQKDGLFRMAPRRSFGIVSPIPEQPAVLRERLKSEMFPPAVLKQLYVGPPRMFRGKQVDFLIVMPGPAQSGPPGHNAALGQNDSLFHDAVAACRVGLHVVGDFQACRMAGGLAAVLADHIGAPPPLPTELQIDQADAEFEAAFGRLEEVAPNILEPLCRLLDQAGYTYQCGIEDHGHMLTVRLLTPHGGRYDIEIDRPLAEIATADELELELARDAEVARHGYEVVRVSHDDVLEKADLIVERLARLA
jgi:hypothetical protein